MGRGETPTIWQLKFFLINRKNHNFEKKSVMSQLNIQNRKLSIIERVITLNDDEILKKVEELINTSLHQPVLKKLTKQELVTRAELSDKDIENGDVYTQEDAINLSQGW